MSVVLTMAVLLLPATASAADEDCAGPTGDQYCPQVEVVAGAGSDTPASADPTGELPFTGLDLGLILAAGAGLLGVGIALRRASRPGSASG